MESVCIPCNKLRLEFSLYKYEDYTAQSCSLCDKFFCDECSKTFVPCKTYFGVEDVCIKCFDDVNIFQEERKQKQNEEERKKRKRKRHRK